MVYKQTLDKIIEYRGGLVPDSVMRTGRRKERAKRPFVPHPDAQVALDELRVELSARILEFPIGKILCI